jgi:hypothetical protein
VFLLRRIFLLPGLHLVLDLFVFRADCALFSLPAACVHLMALIQFLLVVSTIGSLGCTDTGYGYTDMDTSIR